MIDDATCPIPMDVDDRVLLAHGEGARLTRRLVKDVILKHLDNECLRPLADAAILPAIDGRIVVSTDGYVVSPIEFPGGDIGRLAVHGTINDLAVMGAEPVALTVALVIEEGLPLSTLDRIVASLASAARACEIPVVAGDTKVVPRGAADRLFITTAGIGRLRDGVDLGVHRVLAGDRILVSGTIGDHGIAVMAAREGFEFGGDLKSDTAPLYGLMQRLLETGVNVRFARDPTRGGVSAILHELVDDSRLAAVVDEGAVPISEPVRGACELLGIDPLYVANEGKVVLFVPKGDADAALLVLQSHELGQAARIIGEIVESGRPEVLVRSRLGVLRVLDEPSGALLPRIC